MNGNCSNYVTIRMKPDSQGRFGFNVKVCAVDFFLPFPSSQAVQRRSWCFWVTRFVQLVYSKKLRTDLMTFFWMDCMAV